MQELLKALVKAQLEIQPPKKDGENKHLKNKYATLDSIYQACREPLIKNGIVLSHGVETREGRDYLITSLIHVSGETMSNTIPLFAMTSNNASQGFAGGLTYARRYAICCLLALPSDEDDDGESLAPKNGNSEVRVDAKFRAEVIQKIEAVIGGDQSVYADLSKRYGIKGWEDVETKDLPKLLNDIQRSKA